MKFSVLIVAQACVLLSASAGLAQRYTVYGKPGVSGSYTRIGGAVAGGPPLYVQLPLHWVDNLEYTGRTSNTITFPASGTGGSWTCGATNYGPYTADSAASLQQAINDAETCRTASGLGTQINIPAGHVFSRNGSAAITLPQTNGDTSTNFIVLNSTNPLPKGRTICSHGIQDNVAESTEPGMRNLGCDATQLSYQLGRTVTPVASGAFTLANGTTTNSSAYNDLQNLWTVECTAASCNGIATASPDANGAAPHHYAILNAEVRPAAGLASPNSPVKLGLMTETSVSQLATHIHIAYSYIHGDWGDAPVSEGVATGGPAGSNSIPHGVSFSGCNYCSLAYSYLDRMLRPGAEGHAIYLGFGQQIKLVHNWAEGSSSGTFDAGWGNTVSVANATGVDVEDRANRYTYPYSWILAFDAGFCVNNQICNGNSYVRKNAHEAKVANRWLYDGNITENVDNSGAQNGIAMSWKVENCCENYWMQNANITVTNNILRNACQGGSWGFRSSNGTGGAALPTQKALWSNNLAYNIDLGNPGCSSAGPAMGFRVNGNISFTWTAACTRDSAGLTSACTLASGAGHNQSTVNAGDLVNMVCGSDTTFNTAANGTPALTGTDPSGLTIIYSNAGTANATVTGCTFNYMQGWPQYLTYNHNSDFINATTASDPYSPANTTPLVLSRNLTFTNNIFVGGGVSSSFGEGARTQTKAFDGATLTYHHNAHPNRDGVVSCPGHSIGAGGIAACYGEWGTIGVQTTPTTLWGTQTPYCSAVSPSSTCMGFVAGLNTGALSTSLSDYHGYALASGSIFKAGQVNQASDGADLGANIWEIDRAQTATKYICHSACGSGPFVDVPAQE